MQLKRQHVEAWQNEKLYSKESNTYENQSQDEKIPQYLPIAFI